MHLGTKTLLGLGASFALWCTLLYLANAALLRPSFEALEHRNIERNCDRARTAITAKAAEVSEKVGDWSIWDDTYKFVVDLNRDYLERNLSGESLATLGIDFMTFVNAAGEVVHVERCEQSPVSDVGRETMATLVAFEPRLLRHEDSRSSHHGLMRIGDHVVALASRPIHRSDGSGESRGTLIAGRFLDREMVRIISAGTQLQLAVGTAVPGDFRPRISSTEEVAQGRIGLFDLYGRPIGSCTVTAPREIAKEGESALNLLLVALLVSSGLALLTTLFGFDAFVMRRLRRLHSAMRDIAATGDLTQRVAVSGKDEVAELAKTFNELTETLLATQEQLIAANEARTQFLANVSHEVRTPVTALQGFADLLLDPKLPRRQHDDFVETIRRNAKHLLTVLNDLLDSAKLESGQMTVESIATPIAELALDVVDLARPAAAKKALDVGATIQGSIPSVVRTDPTRLRQILTNLMGNAIKFTEQGSVRMVLSEPKQGLLKIDVVDTGIGIPADKLARLFMPFAQADASTTRRFGGTGLGLVLSRNLARLLGGDVTVTSEEGAGSTFSVLIRAAAENDEPRIERLQRRSAPEPTKSKVEPARALEDRRILVVDDAPDNRRLVSFVLRRAGARVDLAENGLEGVERVVSAIDAHEAYDLVIMDMQMPVMNGYQAAAELRRRGLTLPILALTANAMQSDLSECMRAGCTDYATKPIDRENLLATIERLLPKAQAAARNPLADLWAD